MEFKIHPQEENANITSIVANILAKKRLACYFADDLFAYKYCKLSLILEGCVLAGAIYFVSLLVHFKLFLIILTYTPCISRMMIGPSYSLYILFSVYPSLIGRCLSFFQAAIKSSVQRQ